MDTNNTPEFDLASALTVGADEMDSLRSELARRAADDNLLDVTYRTIDTPLGQLLLAATERGLVRVAYEREEFDRVLDTIAQRVSARILRTPARLDDVARELDEYFTGRRTTFDLALDHSLSSGFRAEVQRSLPSIAYGHTASYGEIAALVGRPRAVRAVGTACATNPLPIVVPCHRVVRSDGSYGGYVGGVDAKTKLLTMEGAA
ncbi:methylated-DNA--protein-cysteine methyltransferase [Flexivirga endophytica]|uniref:Methylated-DNA--protein-cysteine methyltransferase n=2 Tax=Flexivirga endophytica TaxID=1849103 RepID=A0A916T430_9MICO|nr:methylated-DNA--protein-cysteine methyltransferase [Flexivirga endophytica]GHB61832.1 methylated-DNA--protein-cysteine methyltransferase [Flexivirga endophytica]